MMKMQVGGDGDGLRIQEEQISRFLASYPTALDSTANELINESKLAKRKLSDLYERQYAWVSDSPFDFSSNDHMLVAEYKGKIETGSLKQSITIAAAKEKVEQLFNLEPETYTMEYRHEGGMVLLNTDEDLAGCLKLWKRAQRRCYQKFAFRVVVPSGGNVAVDK